MPPAAGAAPRPEHLSAELLSSLCQRPSGIRPPAAIAAATRAILNGEISTGPCPYAANGSSFRESRRIARRDAQPRRRFRQRLRAHIVHAQLREIRVAGNRDGLLHVERAVRAVADVVLESAGSIPRSQLPARPSGSLWQRNVRCFNSGSLRSAAIAVTSLNVEPGGYWP